MAGDAEQLANGISLISGDCLAALPELDADSFDACVTDPPYHLTELRHTTKSLGLQMQNGRTADQRAARAGFMGKTWDGGDVAFQVETWEQVYRVLKPGAHLLACGGTRTYHRMACAIEDAGFEVRDCVQWLYGSGFPKSLDVSKAIDKANGDARPVVGSKAVSRLMDGSDLVGGNVRSGEIDVTSAASAASAAWEGFGTALKPACELIVLARKPLSESNIAANVLKWGTGALNIDGCRVDGVKPQVTQGINGNATSFNVAKERRTSGDPNEGRWPANVIHDGSDEVVAGFPESAGQQGDLRGTEPSNCFSNVGSGPNGRHVFDKRGDSGSAARFFYTAKADNDDRLGSKHPTVKPLDLMQYLVRLITPPRGLVLDPFAGTGTTGEAAFREGFRAVLIEREEEYQDDIRRRMRLALCGPVERSYESIKAKMKDRPIDAGPLFSGLAEPIGGGGGA